MALPQLDDSSTDAQASEAPRSAPRRRWAVVLLVLVVLVALVVALVGYNAVRNARGPAAVGLGATEPVPGAPAVPPAGAWQVQGPDSFVGYRVTEPPDVTVVGRTSSVEGTLTLSTDGGQVQLVAGEVRADLRELRSDAEGRDQALRERILETDEFPQAVFTLTAPVDIGTVTAGEPVSARAPGALTIRGRSAAVVADLEARWDGALLRVVASVDISLRAYAVEVPQAAGVDTLRDAAVVEVDLQAAPPA